MKVLDTFEFKRAGRAIPYKEEWFDGNIVQLNHKDLGLEPDDKVGSVVQSLRKYVATNHGEAWTLRSQVITDKKDETVQYLVIQVVAAPVKTAKKAK